MKNLLKYTLFIATFSLIIACNKRLDNYQLDYKGDQLVLFGSISNIDGVTIYLTHTLPPTGTYYFDEIDVTVSDAIIILFENGVAVDTLIESEPGKYFLAYLPVPENNYEIICTVVGYTTVYSDAITYPTPITLESVDFNSDLEGEDGDPACSVRPIFDDNLETENYYAFGFSFYADDELFYGNVFETPDASSLACESGIFIYNTRFWKVYTDNCFAGTEFPFTFQSSSVNHEEEIIPFDKLRFTVSVISRELSDYISNQSETSGINLLFSDPKLNYSNINDGFGVFWAQNDNSLEFHF